MASDAQRHRRSLPRRRLRARARHPRRQPGPPEDAAIIAGNIEDYGATLAGLPDATWETSTCHWMRGYWNVLVDLYTEEEGASDLVLDVRVREHGHGFLFEVYLVYVP